jgi:HK97 family phage major capsid protein
MGIVEHRSYPGSERGESYSSHPDTEVCPECYRRQPRRAPTSLENTMRNRRTTEPTMRRIDREIRLETINRWFREQHDEFRGEAFPAEVQATWDQYKAEAETHERVLAELAERDQRMIDGIRSGQYKVEPGDGRRIDQPDTRTVEVDQDPAKRPMIRLSDGRDAAVERNRSFRDHPVVRDHVRAYSQQEESVIGHHGSFGNLVRAMTTSSGSAVVPTVWASSIIDRARNLSQVLSAGAQLVPMEANQVKIGRLTVDPTAAFRNEGSTVTASDPTFDNVTLTAKTLSALVIGSIEWFQDSPNVDQVVQEAIAKAIATELDLVALFGGLTTGAEVGATGLNRTFANPPNPTGVLSGLLTQAASSVLGGGANGTTQTAASFWNEVIDVCLQPTLFNEASNAVIWSPSAAKWYAKVYESTNQPLNRPPVLDQFRFLTSAQIPSAMTQGTSTTNQTDIFAGDWSQLIIGQRLGFTVQTLVERYAELGQIGIVAHWRGDIGLARPRGLAAYRFIKDV